MEGGEREGERGRKRKTIGGGVRMKERKRRRERGSNVFVPFMKTFHGEFLFQDSPLLSILSSPTPCH